MKELWKRIYINEVKTIYKISSLGNVINTKTNKYIHPFKSHCKKHKTKDDDYYLSVRLYYNGKKFHKDYKVHRLVAIYFIPNPNHYSMVNHIDGNKTNNCVSNLEWCSNKYNIQHAFNHKLEIPIYGENHYKHKLTVKDVITILRRLSNHESLSKIAKDYNVTKQTISGILRNKTWKCIDRKTLKLKENYTGENIMKIIFLE